MPLALEAWSFNHWTTREVPNSLHLYSHLRPTLFLTQPDSLLKMWALFVSIISSVQFSLVTQSCLTLCNSITNTGACSNLCPLSQWCHPTISSSLIPFSSCLQSFPASGSFPVSQLFASGGQSIGVSASVSVLPMDCQDWFRLGWTGWIFLQSGDSQESSPTPRLRSINSLKLSFLYSPTLTSIHDHWKKP